MLSIKNYLSDTLHQDQDISGLSTFRLMALQFQADHKASSSFSSSSLLSLQVLEGP